MLLEQSLEWMLVEKHVDVQVDRIMESQLFNGPYFDKMSLFWRDKNIGK